MTDLDGLMDATTAPMLAPAKPRPHRHQWELWPMERLYDAHGSLVLVPARHHCTRCGCLRDEAAVRRGRTNLRAGKDAERAIAKAYGGTRTGHFGGPDDVIVGDLFVVQSKAGRTWFADRLWDELAKLPRTGGRIPTLIVSDRPGPGHRTRRLVIRTMDDDLALHGGKP